MDPYLEGYLWPDVHNALAAKIREQLTPQLRPRYTARLEIYIVEDDSPESEFGIMYLDVEVVLARRSSSASHPVVATVLPTANGHALEAPLMIPVAPRIPVKIVTIAIRDPADNQLITTIELLSPVNKREPGLKPYLEKRQHLFTSGIHLIEIDLLRRGARSLKHPKLTSAAYLIALTRAPAKATGVWPLSLQDRLPIIPVPLRAPDKDATVDLQAALNEVYDLAAYDLSIDYQAPPPPPPLTETEQKWLADLSLGKHN
jgi:hypothetical protein